MTRDRTIVATDGSCLRNPGPGGWCWYRDDDAWAAGGESHTTNNRMELTALLEALRAFPADRPLHVMADSKYVIDAVTTWIHNWRRRGWRTGRGEPVKNRELIEAIDAELAGREVTFEWVRGHTGHPLNEAADARCLAAATAVDSGTPVVTGPGGPYGRGEGTGTATEAPPPANVRRQLSLTDGE